MFLAQHNCCINVYAFYCCLSLTFMYCCSLGFSRIIFNPTDKGTRHPSVYQKTLSVPVSFLYFSSKIMLGMIHWQTPITSLLCLLPLLNNFYSAFTKSRMRSDQVLFHIPHSKVTFLWIFRMFSVSLWSLLRFLSGPGLKSLSSIQSSLWKGCIL